MACLKGCTHGFDKSANDALGFTIGIPIRSIEGVDTTIPSGFEHLKSLLFIDHPWLRTRFSIRGVLIHDKQTMLTAHLSLPKLIAPTWRYGLDWSSKDEIFAHNRNRDPKARLSKPMIFDRR